MSKEARRRNLWIVAVLLIVAALLFLVRCSRKNDVPAATEQAAPAPAVAPAQASAPVEGTTPAAEVLTPATLEAPQQVGAGAAFSVVWTGPDNVQDFITIVKRDAADSAYANYGDTKGGSPLALTAPVEAGEWELRYVTARSRTVLARRPLTVVAAEATLEAAEEVVLGATLSVAWTGPNNVQDYVTIVAKGTPDGRYGNHAETKQGSPLTLTVPPEAGEAELRYVTGQGGKVLARRALRIVAPEIRMSAPDEAVAGAVVTVEWAGPNNAGDYITLVLKETKDGQYGNYT
ncbi:MAG TPA: hypothetical protein VEA63_09295, partial [Opitutus sp.]|nr:hypothetical protein [Opitutus sp.]